MHNVPLPSPECPAGSLRRIWLSCRINSMRRLFLTSFVCLAFAFCDAAHAEHNNSLEEKSVQQRSIERKNYEFLGPPVGPYSHAVKHGTVLYLSGLTAYGTEAQGKGMAEQARAIFSQLGEIAKAEGTDSKSILKVTVFITDFSLANELREELFRQYDGAIPASSLVQVAKLFSPDISVELEAILGL